MARFRMVVVFAGVLALAVFALAVGTLVRHGGAGPSFGWTDAPDEGRWVVESIEPGGAADGRLRVGDRLVSFDGDALVGRHGTRFHRILKPIGRSYTLRVERSGQELEETLTVGAGPRRPGRWVKYLLVCLVWCGVGLFVGWARPDDPAARAGFIASVSTGLVYLQVGLLPAVLPPVYQPLHMVVAWHFFYLFPSGVRRGRGWRALLWLFYAWGGISCGLRQPVIWTYYAEGAGSTNAWAVTHSSWLQLSGMFGGTLMIPLVVTAVVLVATTYRRLADADSRRRIRWIVYASVVGLSPLIPWTAMELMPPPIQRVVGDATLFGTTLIPLGVAYAVVRHRVFDIAVVVRRGLQYLLAKRALQLLLALPSFAVAATIVTHPDWTIGQLLTGNTTNLLLIAAAAVSLRLRQPILRWLDRRFFREQYDRERVLVGMLQDLERVREPSDVAHLLRAQVDYALHPNAVRLWFEGDPDPPAESLLSRISREGAGPDAPLTSGDALPDGISVVVPMLDSDERLAGLLMLGEKRSEEQYSPEDLSLLGVAARQAAVVRENLLLRQRVSEEHRIRTDVLAHLEPDRVNLVKECPVCGTCYDSTADQCAHDGGELALSLPVTRTVAGRYRLDALIGRGGMGAVYEAFDLRLERTVAIKFLLGKAIGQERALRRFRREARAVARLHHPNIVSLYDHGSLEREGAYLVMELIRGFTLREELDQHTALSGASAADWFAPILDGIAAAHEEGIIHRDLKPENVVRMRPEFGPPVVKILDFGIAKVRPVDTATEHLTSSGMVVGTLGYMSPEQLTGQDVDARSDIFSIGVMVAETLTGRLPFQGDTYGELLASIILDPYHLPGDAPEVKDLDTRLQRCLAKEPRDRYANASALWEELVPALRECPAIGQTGSAGPPS